MQLRNIVNAIGERICSAYRAKIVKLLLENLRNARISWMSLWFEVFRLRCGKQILWTKSHLLRWLLALLWWLCLVCYFLVQLDIVTFDVRDCVAAWIWSVQSEVRLLSLGAQRNVIQAQTYRYRRVVTAGLRRATAIWDSIYVEIDCACRGSLLGMTFSLFCGGVHLVAKHFVLKAVLIAFLLFDFLEQVLP